jgi:hypothetical protein
VEIEKDIRPAHSARFKTGSCTSSYAAQLTMVVDPGSLPDLDVFARGRPAARLNSALASGDDLDVE